MNESLEFLKTPQGIAFSSALFIFVITIILATWRIIGFLLTLIFLIIAVGISTGISHSNAIRAFFEKPLTFSKPIGDNKSDSKVQTTEAIDEIKSELEQEKESVKKIADGFQSLLAEMELQKQKLQAFIEETKERFSKLQKEEPKEQKEK